MQTYLLKCFGTDNDSGNVALVVQNDNLNTKERSLYAKNQNKPVSVFMHVTPDNSFLYLDFHYPHMQSPLCLHGTLAAAYIYFKHNPSKFKVTVITTMHKQQIELEKNKDGIFLTMQTQYLNSIDINDDLIHGLLNTNSSVTFKNRIVASVGSPKLLIEVNSIEILNSINPNLELIYEFSQQHRVNGIYLYCNLGNGACYGRNFNHTDPRLEDAATGVAAGALTYYLGRNLNVHQGDCINNPCIIQTKYLGTKVMLTGKVIIM